MIGEWQKPPELAHLPKPHWHTELQKVNGRWLAAQFIPSFKNTRTSGFWFPTSLSLRASVKKVYDINGG
jgi:hypothetical protein